MIVRRPVTVIKLLGTSRLVRVDNTVDYILWSRLLTSLSCPFVRKFDILPQREIECENLSLERQNEIVHPCL